MHRSRLILACFVLASVLLAAFPAIDIGFSSVFFDEGFPWGDQWWQPLLREATSWFLYLSMLVVVGVYVFNRWTGQSRWQIDGRKVAYLALVLMLGAGAIVNLGLKDNFGRARPRDVTEFGGTKSFTPAFVVSQECRKNCSFSSGEGAAGFFSLALAFALGRKRRILLAAIAVGVVVSFARVAAGAHFLSDVVVSFFVMLIVTDVLHFYMVLPETAGQVSASPGLLPARLRAASEPQAH